MATRKTPERRSESQASPDAPAPEVMSTPVGAGAVDYTPFMWQQLGEIQRTLGAMQASLDTLKETTTSTKSKVQDLSDLRHKVIGGFVVLGVVVSIASGLVVWSANKIWNTFGALAAPAIEQSMHPQPESEATRRSAAPPGSSAQKPGS